MVREKIRNPHLLRSGGQAPRSFSGACSPRDLSDDPGVAGERLTPIFKGLYYVTCLLRYVKYDLVHYINYSSGPLRTTSPRRPHRWSPALIH